MDFDVDLGNDITLTMVHISGGSFLMGAQEEENWRKEGPIHQVTVPDFYIGKYPVTQAQYKAVVGYNPSYFKGDDSLPVEQVNWHKAIAFCEKLSRQTGRVYRLPSEAEWEYACRAETTTPFHYGQTLTAKLANCRDKRSKSPGRTTKVGSFKPNNFGLYDMHGNVGEWCQDVWHKSYNGSPRNGSAWTDRADYVEGIDILADESTQLDGSNFRIWRGGSWDRLPKNCRSASRTCNDSDNSLNYIGFRLVLSD